MRYLLPIVLLLAWSLSACVIEPSSTVGADSPMALEVISVSSSGPVSLVNGRIASLANGARVVLLEYARDGSEREAAVWRRGATYEVAMRLGNRIEEPNEEDMDWIATKLDLREPEFFSTWEIQSERNRIETAHKALRGPVLDLESVRSEARGIVFPLLLAPDLIEIARREHLSDIDEAALIELCFDELNLPPSPEREELFAAIWDRTALSLGARCLLASYLEVFPDHQRVARARRLVFWPNLSPLVAAQLLQSLPVLPLDDRETFIPELAVSITIGPELETAMVADLATNRLLVDNALARLRPHLTPTMSGDQAIAALATIAPFATRPYFALKRLVARTPLSSPGTAALERLSVAYEAALLTCFVERQDLSPVEQSALAICIMEGHVNFYRTGTVLPLLLENPTCAPTTRATIKRHRNLLTLAQRAEIDRLLTD